MPETVTYYRDSAGSWRGSATEEDLRGATHYLIAGGSTLCGRSTSSRYGSYMREGREVNCGQCRARQAART